MTIPDASAALAEAPGQQHGRDTSSRRGSLATLPALAVGMVCVQIGAVQAKLLFPILGSSGTAAIRVVLAAAILLPFLRLRFVLSRTAWRPILAVVAYGICLAAMNTVFYAALSRLPLGPTVAIEFLGPLFLALLGSRRLIDLLWIILAVAGLVVLLQPWQGLHGLDPRGVMLALAAGGFWASYILVGRRLGRHISGLNATALGMGIAGLLLLPSAVSAAPMLIDRPALLGTALLMALASSAVPYSIEMIAMRRLSMRVFAVLMSLEPVVAALMGLLLLGEALSVLRWLAILSIVAASLGSAITDRPPPELV